MRHIMICISGFSGAGKDEVANRLTGSHEAVQTGLADPAKRHMADVYGFTERQLFGPSSCRNEGDPRYPKNFIRDLRARVVGDEYVFDISTPLSRVCTLEAAHGRKIPELTAACRRSMDYGDTPEFRAKVTDPRFSLSPREALQLYCEQLNNLYIDTWIAKGVADQVTLARGGHEYTRAGGLAQRKSGHWNPRGSSVTCFADFRHIHEFVYARGSASASLVPVLVRVKRPSVPKPPYQHRSETEQIRVRDAAFDFVVDNDGTIGDLYAKVDRVVGAVSTPGWAPLAWSDSYVLSESEVAEGYTA